MHWTGQSKYFNKNKIHTIATINIIVIVFIVVKIYILQDSECVSFVFYR